MDVHPLLNAKFVTYNTGRFKKETEVSVYD